MKQSNNRRMSHFISGITILEPFRMDKNASDLCWYPLHDPSSTNSELLYFAKQIYSESTAAHTPIQRTSVQSTTQTAGFPYSSPVAVMEKRRLSDYGTTAGGK